MILKHYSDKEAVQSRKYGLVSTSPPLLQTGKRARLIKGVDLG